MKIRGVIDYLRDKYGETWQYDRRAYQWRQIDGTLYAHKVLTGKDFEGEYTGQWTMCLYDSSNERPPEWLPFSGG